MVKAIAAKDADAAQSAAARPAPASQEEATRTKVLKCPGLRGEVKSKDGRQVIFCKVCNGPREPKAAMSKRRHTDSVEEQDTGAKKAKRKAAPAKKSRPV